MGSLFGGRFAGAGHDVLLVDVSTRLIEQINEHGVTIVEEGGEWSVPVDGTTDPGSHDPVDLALFFVKSYHTEAAARLAKPLVGAETTVASLQNGWGSDAALARVLPDATLIVGVTYNSATTLAPGKVVHAGKGKTLIGPYRVDADGGCEIVQRALESASFEVAGSREIRTEIWKKLVLNAAANAVAALTGSVARALADDPELMKIVDGLAHEAVAVGQACGLDVPAAERIETIHAALAGAGDAKGSMLQDFEAGRRTEIDVINGAVVDEARAHGTSAPLNEAVTALVKGWERARGLA